VRVVGAVDIDPNRRTAAALWERMVSLIERDVAQVAACYPGLRVDTVVRVGRPSLVLAEASHQAWTVVVGSPGLHPRDGRVHKCVSSVVVRQAHSAVIAVPTRLQAANPGGPIVLSCDGSPQTVEATAFAFACASQLGVPLWVMDGADVAKATRTDPVADTLAALERVYPEVPVRVLTRRQVGPSTLASIAADATLMVLGRASPDNGPQVLMPGSIELLHHTRRPLAFVGSRVC
jgi:nucleotide-binding universal stress UspA family protein